MTIEAEALRALSEKAAAGPWKECGHDNEGCPCCTVWSEGDDRPVGVMTHGSWGDDYPSLRFVDGGEGSLTSKVEAYMAQITYGEVPLERGKASAAFIAALVNAYRSGDLIHRSVLAEDTARAAEGMRERAVKAAEDWITVFGARDPKHVSAQTWAGDAVRDIAEAIRTLPLTKEAADADR